MYNGDDYIVGPTIVGTNEWQLFSTAHDFKRSLSVDFIGRRATCEVFLGRMMAVAVGSGIDGGLVRAG